MATNVVEGNTDESLNEETDNQVSVDESSGVDDNCDVNPEEWKLLEEEYVAVDLIGLISENILKDCDKNEIKLVGMFDEHPVLQIGKTLFVGDREEVPGTDILFQIVDNVDPSSSDEEEKLTLEEQTPQAKVQLRCTTRKKLVMRQAVFSKKKDTT